MLIHAVYETIRLFLAEYFVFSNFYPTFVGKIGMRIVLQYQLWNYLQQPSHGWAKESLSYWCMIAKVRTWNNLGDMRVDFPQTDKPGENYYVFSLPCGKRKLLIATAVIASFIYILFVGTYEEYCMKYNRGWK